MPDDVAVVVVTWNAVARVPLFAGLDATRIAAIARLLKPQIVPQRQVVVRRGEPADAMFFIMEGDVEVDIEPPVRLGKGQFFGEIALLRRSNRSATVIAVSRTNLLALDAHGFIKTGPDLSHDDLVKYGWPLARPPYLLETSRPGLFAVGDVRGGNIKRVASAVGEGSMAIQFVHEHLREV